MSRKVAVNESNRRVDNASSGSKNTGVDALLAANEEMTKAFLQSMKSHIRQNAQVRRFVAQVLSPYKLEPT